MEALDSFSLYGIFSRLAGKVTLFVVEDTILEECLYGCVAEGLPVYLMDSLTGFLFVIRIYYTEASNTSILIFITLDRWESLGVHAEAPRCSDKRIKKYVTFGRFRVYK